MKLGTEELLCFRGLCGIVDMMLDVGQPHQPEVIASVLGICL
jgi:hypothetical protein